MTKRTWNALMIGGSTLAGGVLGNWAGSRATLAFGCNFGPWGVAAGAVVGALIGTLLASDPQAPHEEDLESL